MTLAVSMADESLRPLLPLFVQVLLPESDRMASITGGIAALAAIMSGVAAVVAGRQGDRLGYRTILLICTATACIALIPQALVTEVWQLLVLRALVGACIGGTFPVVNAVIGALVARRRQGAAHGLNASASSVGSALGPMLGAAVATTLGFRSVFIAAAVLFGLTSASIAVLVRDRLPGTVLGRSESTE